MGEEELLEPAPVPEVELDPANDGLTPVEVGAKLVITVEPEPSVVVMTAPPATPPGPTTEVDVVLDPVATTTVFVPPLVVAVVVPPALLAMSKREIRFWSC